MTCSTSWSNRGAIVGQQTLAKEAARELVRQEITQHLKPLIDAQVANALGLKHLVTRDEKTGKFTRVTAAMARKGHGLVIEVWEKDPSTQAFTDLMNRAIDKPKEQEQQLQVTGDWDKLAARLASARPKPKTT